MIDALNLASGWGSFGATMNYSWRVAVDVDAVIARIVLRDCGCC